MGRWNSCKAEFLWIVDDTAGAWIFAIGARDR
jgi:hypothetical protein